MIWPISSWRYPCWREKQRQREGDGSGQDRFGGNADAEHRLEEFAAADDALRSLADSPMAAPSRPSHPSPDVAGDQQHAVERRRKADRAADHEHALRMQVIHEQRADRHSGDHAALKAEHDDGGALRLFLGRGHGQDVGLDADEQHALPDAGQRRAAPSSGRCRPARRARDAGAGQQHASQISGPGRSGRRNGRPGSGSAQSTGNRP